MPIKGCYISIFLILLCYFSQAQKTRKVPSNKQNAVEKCKWVNGGASVSLDSMSVIPGTIKILGPGKEQVIYDEGKQIEEVFYNYNTGTLNFPDKTPDSLYICYQVLPFSFHTPRQYRNYSTYDSSAFFEGYAGKSPPKKGSRGNGLIGNPDLKKIGNLSRGFSMGNRQDIFMDSRLNLKLSGKLNDDLNINATINDQNIPVQPQGYSQQLQNFDRVFIEIFNENAKLTAGDLVLNNQTKKNSSQKEREKDPHFLKYFKSIQGGALNANYDTGPTGKAGSKIKAGISKGRFATIKLKVQEGVQGPYQLQEGKIINGNREGLQNAFYIIANSENVYFNGKKLKRGRNNDYVIDYNLGEITFTNEVLITKHTRIKIEFEYADRNYARSIISASHQQKIKDLTLSAHYYNEKDNPRKAYNFKLNQENKSFLSQIGDNIHQAKVSTADSVENIHQNLNPIQSAPGIGRNEIRPVTNIFYTKKDTLVNGKTYPIFKYKQRPDSSGVFRVNFYKTPPNQGNYKILKNTVNGRVFKWIAPKNGQPGGNYTPKKRIPTPRQKKMITTQAQWKINKKDRLKTEVAFSENDLNILSQKDKSDDKGNAFMLNYLRGDRPVNFLPGYNWKTGISYEWTSPNFTPVERFRDIEFNRNWNMNLDPYTNESADTSRKANHFLPANDHLVRLHTGIKKNTENFVNYQFSGRHQPDQLTGFQQHIKMGKSVNSFQIGGEAFQMKNQQSLWQADWHRFSSAISYQNNKLTPGYELAINRNTVRDNTTDSILFAEDYFQSHKFFIQKQDSAAGFFYLDYNLRSDKYPENGTLSAPEISHTTHAKWHRKFSKTHRLKFNFVYRFIQDNSPGNNENLSIERGQRNTLLGEIFYKNSFFEDLIQTEADYTIANTRELKREFVYVKVPTRQGTYTWRDENNNGIEEITEFYKAKNPDERNYAKMYAPSGEYLLAYQNAFRYQLRLSPPDSWDNTQGLKKILNRFSNQTMMESRKKVSKENLAHRILPFIYPDDAHLISLREKLRSTLYYNRHETKFGFKTGLKKFIHKQLLNYGFEKNETKRYNFDTRYSFHPQLQLTLSTLIKKRKNRISDLNQQNITGSLNDLNRHYNIHSYSFKPELTWRIQSNIRIGSNYEWISKKNHPGEMAGKEQATRSSTAGIHKIGTRLNINNLQNNTINASVKLIKIDFKGKENTAYGYEMLEALQPGTNFKWNIMINKPVVENIKLSLQYNGRKSPDHPVIHFGRINATARF